MLISTNQKSDRKKIIWEYFPDSVWKKAKVLDCASGDGRKGMQYYIKLGLDPANVVAVDCNSDLLKVLLNLGIKTYCVTLGKQRLQDIVKKKFDLIICAETLEHVGQDTADFLIEDFLCLLSIGGNLVVTFPVNVYFPKNSTHIRQPDVCVLLKKLLRWFENVEMRKYGWRTYILFFTGKKAKHD